MAITAVCLCVLLLGILFVKEQRDGAVTTDIDQGSIQKLLKRIDKETVTALILPIDGHEIKLVKGNDGWSIDGDKGTPINKTMIDTLLEKIELILALREIGERELTDYGLDKPSRTVTLFASGEKLVISFGNRAFGDVGYYFTLDGKTVHLVDESLYNAFSIEMSEIIALPAIKSYGEISSITINGSISNDTELIKAIEKIAAERFVDYRAKDESIYGLGGKETKFTLLFSSGVQLSFSLGSGESDEFVYLRLDESDAVYLIVADKNDTLLQYMR